MKPLLLAALLAACGLAQTPDGTSRAVVDTSKSPKAILHPVPVSAVTLREGFWSARRKVNVDVSLPSLRALFEEKGILDNFRRLSGRKEVARRGPLFTDSDIYKWLEAVAFTLESGDQPELRKTASAIIDDIAAAQEHSGYINTFFTRENLDQRHKNMQGGHELYCLGHMIQAGVAWDRATGDRKLLDVATRMVEYLLREFGPDHKPIFEGHPEIELSLVELYRTTGDPRYLNLAKYFLAGDPRNLKTASPQDIAYLFTIKPFAERTKLEGHAVRAMYAASGATDYYLETGDPAYWNTLEKLWEDMVHGKIYITGGVGSRAVGETFGEPYELPNQQAYTESCAAIGTMFWNWRMLQASGDAKYMDLFERSLYNGANSGLSLSGNLYCYRNPLELVGNPDDRIRNPWYDCTCCPPNLQRILASLPGYFYGTSRDGVWIHLFDNNELNWKLEDGMPLKLSQTTRYPWDGEVRITVTLAAAREFTLFVRRPAWAHAVTLTAAGVPLPAPKVEKGYFAIHRIWKPGDVLSVQFDMKPHLVAANPLVRENIGKVALERGPLVYCLEGLDQPSGASLFDWALEPDRRNGFDAAWKPDMLGGITMLLHAASRPATANSGRALYDELRPSPRRVFGNLNFIPYYTFHNREITAMEVWVPYRESR